MKTIRDLDPEKLYILPLGVGDAFTQRFYHSSLLIIAGGRGIAVDCPSPYRRILHEAGEKSNIQLDIGDIDHIILTHLHGDHCNGIEEFGYYSHYLLGGKRANLYLLPENRKPLWENRLKAPMGDVLKTKINGAGERSLETYFEVHEWEEGNIHALAGENIPFGLQIRRTRHSVPCFGFRMVFGNSKFAYSGDTGLDQEHMDFLAGADMIVYECGPGDNHTPLTHLLEQPDEIRNRIYMIHTPDEFHDVDHPRIPLLREGWLYQIG